MSRGKEDLLRLLEELGISHASRPDHAVMAKELMEHAAACFELAEQIKKDGPDDQDHNQFVILATLPLKRHEDGVTMKCANMLHGDNKTTVKAITEHLKNLSRPCLINVLEVVMKHLNQEQEKEEQQEVNFVPEIPKKGRTLQ